MGRTLSFLLVALFANTARAQENARSHSAIAIGPSIALGAGAIGGVHLQLSAETRLGRSISLRADFLAQVTATASADPLCVPEAPRCESYTTPYPAQVYSASLSLVVPLGPFAHRLYALGGVGAYYGTGFKSISEKYGTTGGALVGVGLRPGSASGRGIGLEGRYHHLFGGLGRLSAAFVPSLTLWF